MNDHATDRIARQRRSRLVASLLAMASTVSGCGGGDNPPPPPVQTSPSPTPAPGPGPAPSPSPAPAPTPSPTPTPAPTPAPTPPPAPTAVTANLLGAVPGPYTSYIETFADGTKAFSSADLFVLDGATTDPLTLVETGGTWTATFPLFSESVQDVTRGTASDLQVRAYTYLKAGRLNVLDLRSTTGLPAARVVSSLSTRDICGTRETAFGSRAHQQIYADEANALRSGLVFRLPGPDRICDSADDEFRAVTLDMSASDPGIPIPEYVMQINDASGAVASHLVKSGTTIQQRDTAFANPIARVTVGADYAGTIPTVNGAYFGGTFLYREGNDVRAFNLETGAGPTTVTTLTNADSAVVYYRRNETFLIVYRAGASRILRIDDALVATTLASEADLVTSLAFTSGHVVYYAGTGRIFRNVPRTGGAPATLVACNRPTNAQAFGFALGDNFFCGPLSRAPSLVEAATGVKVVAMDGTIVRSFPNAAMISPGVTNPAPYRQGDWQNVLLAENLSTSTVGYKDSTLTLYDGATVARSITYGVVPVNAMAMSIVLLQAPGFPKVMYVAGTNLTSAPTDIFVLRDAPPALVRRTNRVP